MEPIVQERPIEEPKKPARLTSLDAFRGATVALMLLVNNLALGESTPLQFIHAPFGEWARVVDLVFPWFLFCAGLALPFSYASAKKREMSYLSWSYKALGRATGLLGLGMFLDSAVYRHPVFGLGVLQLIGLASFVAALAMPLRPIVRSVVALVFILVYGAALAWYPLPSHGHAVLTEEANLVRYINGTYLQGLGLRGLPSVVPTAALVMLGSLIGPMLMPPTRRKQAVAIGTILTIVGAVWSYGHPMSKAIWTSPYVVFAGGLGTVVVTLLAYLLDGRPWSKFAAPFLVFGTNPLLAYAGPILVKTLVLSVWTLADGRTLIKAWLDTNVARYGPWNGGWVYTLEYIAATWLVLAWMRRKGLVLRL